MSAPVIPVAGTLGAYHERDWFRPRSRWWGEAERAGVSLLDKDKPFEWSTALDGIVGRNGTWQMWGSALTWYAHWMGADPVSLVCHSHGGQVALYAIAYGLRVETLVTVAMPPRRDVEIAYEKATRGWKGAKSPRRWVHIYTDERWSIPWQRLGGLGDGYIGWKFEMPDAENIFLPGYTHTSLMDFRLWREKEWFRFLVDEQEGG